MNHVTSVSQLSDVQPTDWAFQALQLLGEHYGCIAGYPKGNFLGSRVALRYEFAAALNACLDHISDKFVTQEDLATVKALQGEFKVELSALKGRVDRVEAHDATLDAQQFSATTQLKGEAIFGITNAFGGNKAVSSGKFSGSKVDVWDNTIFADRVRLYLNSSFTGKDLLKIRLQASNTPNLNSATGTNMSRLGFDSDTQNTFILNQLYYQFPVGNSAKVSAIINGSFFDFVDTINPLFGSDGTGAISYFGVRSPIYRHSSGGAGAALTYNIGSKTSVTLAYLANKASDVTFGLFGGSYAALAQLTLKPNKAVSLGLTYMRSYNAISTGTGSAVANSPFGNGSESIMANSYGLESSFRLTSGFTLGGWVGFDQVRSQDLPGKPTANILNYAVSLGFPDLLGKGNLGGLVIGQPPRVISNGFGLTDPNASLHLEAFYRFQLNNYIVITPGVIVLMNPEHNSSNNPIVVGTVRTTFTF